MGVSARHLLPGSKTQDDRPVATDTGIPLTAAIRVNHDLTRCQRFFLVFYVSFDVGLLFYLRLFRRFF